MNGEEGGGLSAGRSRRSTAGNRMRELLEQERERLELKRGNEDDEMFKEEEGDVDFEARIEEAEDIIDSDFDQSSDDGDEGDDELQGERAIEEEERIAKKLSRVKAAPVGVRKVTIAAPKPNRPSTSNNAIQGQSSTIKRISFASNSTPGDGSRQRSSTRKSTISASLSVQARIKLEDKRRQEASERATPKRKKIRLSQADRIAEALEMEEYNRESLSKYFKLEEERRERDRRQSNKQINGPYIRFRSIAEDRNAQQRMVQDMQERNEAEKAEVASINGAITTDPVIAAREAAKKEREGQSTKAPSERAETDPPSNKVDGIGDTAEVITEVEESSAQHSRTTTDTDVVMTNQEDDKPSLVVDEPEPGVQLEEDQGTRNGDTVEHTPEVMETAKETAADTVADMAEETAEETAMVRLVPDFETRTYVSLHQLPADVPWQECWSHILGSHVDWSHYTFVPARNRPLRPRQSVCPITGLAAVYKDPRSGIAFANKEAYDMLTQVIAGSFKWSGQLISEDDSSIPIKRNYEPLEMGCWLDSIDERGACHVLDKAANKVTPQIYRTKMTVAPGDEQAIVAAAQALPAGTTRSGIRRAHDGST